MEWLKSVSWVKLLGWVTSFVVYLSVFAGMGALFLACNGVAVSPGTVSSIVFIGAFMVIGRDILARPLSQVAQNIVTGVPWSKGVLPPAKSDEEDDTSEEQ